MPYNDGQGSYRYGSDGLSEVCSPSSETLGYDSLKEHQIEVVLDVAGGRDVFAVLPTDYGKSLCYACLPSLFDNMLDLHTSRPPATANTTSIWCSFKEL